jgi:hypothetical protein
VTTNLPTIYTLPPAPLPTSLEGEHRASLELIPNDIEPDFGDITTSTYVEYSLGEHSDSAQLDVLVEAHELHNAWAELGEMPVQLRALDCLEALDQIALKTLDQDPDLSGLALVEARRQYLAQLVLLYLQPEVKKLAPTLDWDTYASRAVGLGEGSAPQTWEEDCRRYQELAHTMERERNTTLDRVGQLEEERRELQASYDELQAKFPQWQERARSLEELLGATRLDKARALQQRDAAREKVSQLEEQLLQARRDFELMEEERDAAQNDLAWERAKRGDDQTRIQELEAWQADFHARGEDTNRAIRDLCGKLEEREATITAMRQEASRASAQEEWLRECIRQQIPALERLQERLARLAL